MYPKSFLFENDKVRNAYVDILREDGHENFNAFIYSTNHRFKDINFKDKRVVDVGSGKGLMTIYAALNGAKQVLSLEPELEGSRNEVLKIQKKRIDRLGLKNVEILRQDFNTWTYNDEPFDIILSVASINHLHESPFHALRDAETYKKYIEIAYKMKKMLKKSGISVITDSCRYGLFFWLREIGINRPWRPNKRTSVNFRYHQNPGVWKKIFHEAGFTDVDVIYPLPFKLRSLKGIVDSPLALLRNFK